MLKKIIFTDNSTTTILIRIMVGWVFFTAGIQKFINPAEMGAGRFVEMGFPAPEFTAVFVGFFEVFCGLLILAGLITRLAAIPLIIVMLVAIFTTKFPVLSDEGFWQMMHAWRLDLSMLLGSVFLLIKGSGRYSADKKLLDS